LPKYRKKLLFVGLGTMGYPMAGHLSKNQDLNLFVHNRTSNITKNWLKDNQGNYYNPNDHLKSKFDGLITCLKDDASIIEVLINQNLISTLKKNSFIVDHSTTSLGLVQKIASNHKVIANNVSFYDAPVSGGEVGAINGSLSVMFGGPLKKINIITKIMNSYASSIIHIGPSGHGQLTKMVNQICIAGLIQALSEGILLGKSLNLNMKKVFEAISKGAAQSWQMDNRFETMINEQFDFGFAVDLMIKDLKIALKESKDNNLNLKTSNQVLKQYKKLSKQGDGDLDTSSLIKLLNK
jgi:3-hydroxyisobutyrate dehydrogenase